MPVENNMHQASWLKQNMDNEQKRIHVARQVLKKNPASYSAKVALQSAEHRLAELKRRLEHDQSDPS